MPTHPLDLPMTPADLDCLAARYAKAPDHLELVYVTIGDLRALIAAARREARLRQSLKAIAGLELSESTPASCQVVMELARAALAEPDGGGT